MSNLTEKKLSRARELSWVLFSATSLAIVAGFIKPEIDWKLILAVAPVTMACGGILIVSYLP